MGIFTNAYILPVVHFYVREIYDCILIDNSLGRKKIKYFIDICLTFLIWRPYTS